MADNDTAGKELIRSALPLIHKTTVSVCVLPEGRKDAAECTTEELRNSVAHRVPILDYIVENVHKKIS
jgi:DNA primase